MTCILTGTSPAQPSTTAELAPFCTQVCIRIRPETAAEADSGRSTLAPCCKPAAPLSVRAARSASTTSDPLWCLLGRHIADRAGWRHAMLVPRPDGPRHAGSCLTQVIGNSITTVLPGHEPQTFAFDQIMGPSTSQDDVFHGEPGPVGRRLAWAGCTPARSAAGLLRQHQHAPGFMMLEP